MLRSLTMSFMFLWSVSIFAESDACTSKPHKQFDFWLGQWQVKTSDGKIAGTNIISKEYNGCVLHERYNTGKGYKGESLNIYDATRKLWHQTWVDNTGLLLILEGGLQEGKMVLEGEVLTKTGEVSLHRITWTPLKNGHVRQLWQSKVAGKQEWSTVFDGHYVPVRQ